MFDLEEELGTDVNGVELEECMLLRESWDPYSKVYCIMRGGASGKYYIVSLTNDTPIVKPISEAVNYEAFYGQELYKGYRNESKYRNLLRSY